MIPFAVTTVDLATASAQDEDGDAAQAWEPVAYGVPANVVSPSGAESLVGGSREVVDAVLIINTSPVLDRHSRIYDRSTGETYQVTWVRRRVGFGLDHQRAGLISVKGASVG